MTQKTRRLSYILFLFSFLISNRAPADPIIVPLQLAGRLLIVDITVNKDQQGAFILDTGSSDLILNSQYFRGERLYDSRVIGLNGDVEKVESQRVDLRLGHIEWENINAAIVNLAHLERRYNRTILGLLGASVLEKVELQIDFGRLQLVFYPLDEDGNRLNTPCGEPPPSDVFPLQFKKKIPYLEKQYGGRPLKLGLDSAAEANLFHKGLLPFVDHCLSDTQEHVVRGVSGQMRKAVRAKLKGFTLGSAAYWPMPAVFISLDDFNRSLSGPRLDGILGIEFFKQYKTALNYRKGELYIWNHRPREQAEELLVNSCE